MGAPLLLLALTLFPVAAAASLEPHYMVVFPAVIQQSQEEKLYIHFSSLTETVHLAVTLQTKAQNHTLVEQDVEKPGTFQSISFQVPDLMLTPKKTDDSETQSEEVAFLHVLIRSGDSVLLEGHKKILVKPQKNIILIETDKGLYKPGETVKFRIVNLDENLKVIKNEDPEYNRIAEWLDVKSNHGIVDLSFPLASEASLGKYTISVQKDMAQKTFSVEEYVLKKFEVKIEHPPHITTADEEFQLDVCGKYTYGKPVQGKVEITVMTFSQAMEDNFTSQAIQNQSSWTNKDGCATFTIKTEALEINEADHHVIAAGKMVENGTGAHSVETALIPVATIMKFVEFINLNPFYKRGIPYTGKISCHSVESPLRNETVHLIVDVNDEKTQLSFLTDEKGEAHFTLDTTSWNSTMVSLRGTYNPPSDDSPFPGESEGEDSFHWLKPFYSESDSFIEIKAKNDVMSCDQEQEVQVDYILSQNKLSSEEDHINFYYLVIAKGKILFSREKKVPITQLENLQGSFSLTLPVGNDFLPDIKLLVYAVFSDGEVVADVEQFEVEKCFRHKVALEFSHKEEVPGSKVRLNLKAAPGSLCSVRAVDKSVLLKTNQTLTADKLYEAMFEDSFTVGGRGLPYRLEDFEAYPCLPQQPSAHKKARMGAPWYQSEADVYNLLKKLRMKIFTNTRIKKPVSCVLPDFEKKIYLRKLSKTIVGSQPTLVDSKPHSEEKEKPKPRTLFPETWIWDLVSIGGDGQASLQAAVPDTITEWNANTFCVADTGFGFSPLTSLRVFQPFFVDVSLPYSVIQGETFRLKATVFNYLTDCIQPGGVLQEKTQNAFLCPADNTISEEFSLTLPAEVLEGSARVTFSVIGDIMGPALQNLDHLLSMPFGCGEQNMVQFAPNIFILQYLNKTKQLNPEIKDKALKFLTTGYQRQLLYKHDDGSYSAFGKGDEQGNTWLTAFVARSFGQASSHIYIDKDHVHSALRWLQKHQLPSGCFQSVGKLFNNDLKGGVDDTISLTAYIAAALVELHLEKNDTMLDNALHCLKKVTLDETSLYVKALMAYVFTLSKDMEMRKQVLDMAEKETAQLLTSQSADEKSSSMIETVAYIVLAHVSKPDLSLSEASVSKLVRWLSAQRNAFGGFASTQDTVVSLQALAQYAALIPQEIRDVKVAVKGEGASPLEFHVHRNNKLVLHQASLLADTGTYTVQATGSGCVYIQTTWYYNIPPPKTEEVFVLDVETVPRECDGVRKEFDIRVSIRYVGDRGTSNMALVEVEMLSGFIPVQSSVKELEKVPLVKKTEVKPDKITIYLEELGESSLKLNISVEQDIEVQNLKAATVHVYDYYKPDDRTAREYAFPCSSGNTLQSKKGTFVMCEQRSGVHLSLSSWDPVAMETESEQNSNSTSGSSSSGGSTRPQISQMSLYERQAVQALQALQRQPNAAQYFHQFMLQQQFNSAQLHSLAAVQQATIAASRQASSPNTSTSQQTTTTQASINLATTSAAQLISRSQSVSSPSATTLTQSVLLGNTTSPPLNQSQAQMYLRPQLGNLLQVNRTLGRNVPLASQLILMPNGAVAAVQQEVPPTQSPGVHADTDQVQNLAMRSQQTSAANAQLQGSAQKTALPGSSQASGLPQAASTGQAVAVAQASSGAAGQSLNLSQGAAGGNGVSGGVVAGGGGQPSVGLSQSSSAGAAGSCQRKGTGVVQPLPVAAAQAVTVSQGSQTETENAAAKKGDADSGGQQTVGMNLTRTATPAPSQTLISSATYTQIQPHSLIQQQQQIHLQKQVVIQQQIAIHHQQQFQHRQSQLLHTATHLQLAQQQQQQQAASLTPQQQQQAQPPQQQAPPQNQQQAQTLVVQPMLQSQPQHLQLQQDSPCQPATKSPVPIQSKSLVTPIKPPQLGPAKMSATQQPPPHIPVQVVGTRQQGSGQAQALGLAQIAAAVPTSRGMPAVVQPVSQSHAASPSSSSAPASSQEAPPLTTGVNLAQVQGTAHMVKSPASSPVVAQMPAAFYMQSVQLPGKSQTLPVKRKAESEEEKEEPPSVTALLPARSSPATDSPKNMEEKSGLGDNSDTAAIATPNATSSEGASATPTSASTPNLALVSRQMGDSKPPQAIVKPQILTHIIEGFVIQEGAEPFPVGCSQLLKESEKPVQGEAPSGQNENLSSNSLGEDSASMELDKKANLLKCEYCGKYAPATQFRGSKRFCSMTCAKRYNVSCSHQFRLQRKKMKELQEANYARVRRRGPRRSSSEIARTKIQGKRHRGQEDSSRGSDNSSYDEALSPTSPGPLSVRASHGERDLANSNMAPPTPDLHGINPVFLSSNPSRWSVEEVYEFIASLQGCQEIAEEFRSQEIDGQALLLLKEEHLMSAMNMKLGPALKICAKINVLKET
ncbi:hypothetical protein DUI87_16998 [Hirundo rustica rustica]|uniref:NTR domain-containing protein n=2 Tax=Hirundo rustica TaxID=43150 RepID=A0A3M0K856_HIRRU|nr:hypothetical protein DUI87_16998 [Hirundo rustica rustica]